MQTRRHEGGYRDRTPQLTACAPQTKIVPPPSEDCAPKKLTGSGLLERKSRSKLVFFVEWHQILWRFWDEDLFFWRSPVIGRKKRLNFRFRQEKSLAISREDLFFFFFFGDHLFSVGKTAWISDFGRKIPRLFAPNLVHLIQTGINFSCPSAPLELTLNKLLDTPKIYFSPPVTLSWRRAWYDVPLNPALVCPGLRLVR